MRVPVRLAGDIPLPCLRANPPQRVGWGTVLCARGFRAHSGWAVVVGVIEPCSRPLVAVRRCIETADAVVAGSTQPFHDAARLPFAPNRRSGFTQTICCSTSPRELRTNALQAIVGTRQGS